MTGFLTSLFGGAPKENKEIARDAKVEAFAKLIGAIKNKGDCSEEINNYIAAGGELTDKVNQTFDKANFLHLARAMNKQAYDMMIAQGYNRLTGTRDAARVLYYAAHYNKPSAVKDALNSEEFATNGSNPYAYQSTKRLDPLAYALYLGNIEVAEKIAKNSSKPRFSYMTTKDKGYEDDRYISIRDIAVQSKNPNAVIDFLEEHGFNLGGQDQGGSYKTLLEYAIEANKPEIVNYLMTKTQVLDNEYTNVILNLTRFDTYLNHEHRNISNYSIEMQRALERAREAFSNHARSIKSEGKFNTEVEKISQVEALASTEEDKSIIFTGGEEITEEVAAAAKKEEKLIMSLLSLMIKAKLLTMLMTSELKKLQNNLKRINLILLKS